VGVSLTQERLEARDLGECVLLRLAFSLLCLAFSLLCLAFSLLCLAFNLLCLAFNLRCPAFSLRGLHRSPRVLSCLF